MRSTNEILDAIERFEPDEGNWLKLEELLTELWNVGKPELGVVNLLKVLERFPEDDGAGVLWSIVHGMENFDSYESALIASIRRQPSMLGLVMIRRIETSGRATIVGHDIRSIYVEMLAHPNLPMSIRDNLVAWVNKS